MIAIHVNDAGFVSRMDAFAAGLSSPRDLLLDVGREGVDRLRAHFLKKDQTEPNKMGAPRTHFWRAVMRSVQAPQVQEGLRRVLISINHPAIAQKIYGGEIRAKNVKNLAIPVTPEAYAHAPRTFEAETGQKLFVWVRGGKKFLAAKLQKAGVKVEYVLKPSVWQKPDPTALPDMVEFGAAMVQRAHRVITRQEPLDPWKE